MKTLRVAGFVIMALAACSLGYAAGEEGSNNNAFIDGVGKILRLPITMMDKATASAGSASNGTSASEDVAVAPVYSLDSETTG